jgi:CheY-like chemotaxis protein
LAKSISGIRGRANRSTASTRTDDGESTRLPAIDGLEKRILVVEDDDLTRDALTLFLEGEGHTVVPVKNGKQALDYLRHSSPPNLILLDLMDGCELREEQLRDSALASIPVVVLTEAGVVAEPGDLMRDAGYLQKPVDADQLLSAIERFTVREKPVVLIIEDEKALGIMLDEALRHYGFDVQLALTGQQAVDFYREHHDKIDIVLSDVQMPDLDGPTTLAALWKINPNLKCCFMSGSTGKYSANELLEMGASHVFAKPFASLSLLARLLWDMVVANRRSPEGRNSNSLK